MWIESFEDSKISFEINENYEQAAIAVKNLNKIDQAIDILKRGISVDKNPNPFENKKNLKMFTLLEKFENEILKNKKNEKEKHDEIINLNNIVFELKNENKTLKSEVSDLKIENKNFQIKNIENNNFIIVNNDLKKENDNLKTENDNLKTNINELKTEINNIKNKNKKIKKNIKSFSNN
jgi:hypothetical protein